jgi:hypothetical protein
MMVKSLLAALLMGLSLTCANAFDLTELAPCKPAAAKYCDMAGGMTMTNALRCGARLAAISRHVGKECRLVLVRYGQLAAF